MNQSSKVNSDSALNVHQQGKERSRWGKAANRSSKKKIRSAERKERVISKICEGRLRICKSEHGLSFINYA